MRMIVNARQPKIAPTDVGAAVLADDVWKREEQLIEAVMVALGKNFNTDWSALDALRPDHFATSSISDGNILETALVYH